MGVFGLFAIGLAAGVAFLAAILGDEGEERTVPEPDYSETGGDTAPASSLIDPSLYPSPALDMASYITKAQKEWLDKPVVPGMLRAVSIPGNFTAYLRDNLQVREPEHYPWRGVVYAPKADHPWSGFHASDAGFIARRTVRYLWDVYGPGATFASLTPALQERLSDDALEALSSGRPSDLVATLSNVMGEAPWHGRAPWLLNDYDRETLVAREWTEAKQLAPYLTGLDRLQAEGAEVPPPPKLGAGFDPLKASALAIQVASDIRFSESYYTPELLADFQRACGLVPHGRYDGQARGALLFYLSPHQVPLPIFQPSITIAYHEPS